MNAPTVKIPTTAAAAGKRQTRKDLAEAAFNAPLKTLSDRIAAMGIGVTIQAERWDASGGAFPAGASKGDGWFIGTAGAIDGVALAPGDLIVAAVGDAATDDAGDWAFNTLSQFFPAGIPRRFWENFAGFEVDGAAYNDGDEIFVEDFKLQAKAVPGADEPFVANGGGQPFIVPSYIKTPTLRAFNPVGDGDPGNMVQDTAAFVNLFKWMIANRPEGGTVEITPSWRGGPYVVDDLPELSMRADYAGGYAAPLMGSLHIAAEGADVLHGGAGTFFTYRGQTGGRRLVLRGGEWTTTQTVAPFWKMRDAAQLGFHPAGIAGDKNTPILILIQNWHNWSENVMISGGANGKLRLTRGLVQVELQSTAQAMLYEGVVENPGGTSSFSRFHFSNIFTQGCGGDETGHGIVLKMDAGAYDSLATKIDGNKRSDGPVVVGLGVHADMVIHAIKMEGASDLPDQYAIDMSDAVTIASCFGNSWGGSKGEFAPGSGTTGRRVRFNTVVQAEQFVSDRFELADARELAPRLKLGVDLEDATPTEIISAEQLSEWGGNTTILVSCSGVANEIDGTCKIKRKQGESGLILDTLGTPLNLAFSVVSGGLTVTQTSGADVAAQVSGVFLNG